MSEADGEYKRTVYHRGVFSPHPIQHIYERSANPKMERGVSYTQTTCASQPSTLPSKKSNNKLKRHGGTDTLLQKQRSDANPDKMQVTTFNLRNREAKRSLQVSWNGVDLENTDTPKYLGVTLDRTLNYKTHIHNTKMKVATRNNILKKLANSRWGTNARTIRTTALCYSTAEYATPVWERSAYAHLLNPELNQACRAITGCLKPTNVENLYLLAGIAAPKIRRSVCARVERTTKQVEFGHTPARRRLKSRRSFLTSVQPVHFPAKVVRVNEWKRRLEEKAHAGLVNLYEDLATGHDSPWLNWRCLNRLRTGYTCSKEQRKKWGYFNWDTTCECGLATENTSHMLQCTLLAQPCTMDDLLEFNDTAQACIERWKKIVWWYDMMMMIRFKHTK